MIQQPLIFFYSDAKCENQMFFIQFEGITLAGKESETKTIWAKNISGYELVKIEIHVIDQYGKVDTDVKIVPDKIGFMPPEDVVEISMIFHPSPMRTEPLKGEIQISYVMVKRA